MTALDREPLAPPPPPPSPLCISLHAVIHDSCCTTSRWSRLSIRGTRKPLTTLFCRPNPVSFSIHARCFSARSAERTTSLSTSSLTFSALFFQSSAPRGRALCRPLGLASSCWSLPASAPSPSSTPLSRPFNHTQLRFLASRRVRHAATLATPGRTRAEAPTTQSHSFDALSVAFALHPCRTTWPPPGCRLVSDPSRARRYFMTNSARCNGRCNPRGTSSALDSVHQAWRVQVVTMGQYLEHAKDHLGTLPSRKR